MFNHFFAKFFFLLIFLGPVSGVAESYKVFRGDGFSFRYRINWEEGLPQADTTRALVRAISSQTGYSASCNVNVSFVDGLDKFTQKQINDANHKLHDLEYLSRVKTMVPDFKIIDYSTETYFSMQPASSIEFTAMLKTYNASQVNQFFSIMTIRKPNRYVLTCRAEPYNFMRAREAQDLIISSFLIFQGLGAP